MVNGFERRAVQRLASVAKRARRAVAAGEPCLCGEEHPLEFVCVCAHVPCAFSLAQEPSRGCVLPEDSLAEESRAVREL